MTRSKLFWIVFALCSAAAVLAAWNLAPRAFPLVSTDIGMDRQMAITRAGELAERFDWGPGQPRVAASYETDNQVQNYVELEAGGVEAFRELLAGDRYSPYTWRVRLFQEQVVEETELRFTPDGRPYGFTHTLPEDAPGAALEAGEARGIAESTAGGFWGVDLDAYALVESADNRRPGGRVDHTFVYQRTDGPVGEADIRLRLVVSGERLSELRHFMRVPESFERSFEEMRADNTTLFNLASALMFLVFLGGGCLGGLFFLLRRRALIWRQPMFWGVGIALLNLLVLFNAWPLQWMEYDTALSLGNHVGGLLIGGVSNFLVMAALLSVVFMAAESLSRLAFPGHLQLWKLWSPEAVSTRQLLGLTLGGFLLVGFDLFYVTGSYYVASTSLDWWYPSSALIDPNIVAQYFPWLTAVVQPLQAAFMEEALFRAVPISAAVLLGRRYGGSAVWIGAAFLLQAVVFGAAHANYPQMPFYARTLELIPSAVVFGAVFYYWGLLPAILLHFWYNVVWFAAPVFASEAPGIWLDQTLIVMLALLPFWVILLGRLRRGHFSEAPASLYNRAWQAEADEGAAASPAGEKGREAAHTENGEADGPRGSLHPLIWRGSVLAGLAGIVLLAIFLDTGKSVEPLQMTREEAIGFAREQLPEHDLELSGEWQPHASIMSYSPEHVFVWREGGREVYEDMLDSYLHPLRWDVRFVNFQAPVEERAEEYRFRFTGTDEVRRYRMELPEARPGARLSEEQARERAESAASARFGHESGELRPVSANETSHPGRSDWELVFSDPAWPLDQGEARIGIRLSGDRLSGYERYVHLPEEWERSFEDWRATTGAVGQASTAGIGLLVLGGMVLAIIRWSRGHFHVPVFAATALGILLLTGVDLWNAWPALVYQFSTSEPFTNQMLVNAGGALLGGGFQAVALGLLAGMLAGGQSFGRSSPELARRPLRSLMLVAGPVLLGAAVFVILASQLREARPDWGNFVGAATYMPALSRLVAALLGFAVAVLVLGLLSAAADYATDGWTRRKALGLILFLLAGLLFRGPAGTGIPLWLASGVLMGLVLAVLYIYVLRHHRALLLPAAGFFQILTQLDSLFWPMHPGAAAGAALSILAIAALAWFGYRRLLRDIPGTPV